MLKPMLINSCHPLTACPEPALAQSSPLPRRDASPHHLPHVGSNTFHLLFPPCQPSKPPASFGHQAHSFTFLRGFSPLVWHLPVQIVPPDAAHVGVLLLAHGACKDELLVQPGDPSQCPSLPQRADSEEPAARSLALPLQPAKLINIKDIYASAWPC